MPAARNNPPRILRKVFILSPVNFVLVYGVDKHPECQHCGCPVE
jgi:hypothetical protein